MISYKIRWRTIWPFAVHWTVSLDGDPYAFGYCYGFGARKRAMNEALNYVERLSEVLAA